MKRYVRLAMTALVVSGMGMALGACSSKKAPSRPPAKGAEAPPVDVSGTLNTQLEGDVDYSSLATFVITGQMGNSYMAKFSVLSGADFIISQGVVTPNERTTFAQANGASSAITYVRGFVNLDYIGVITEAGSTPSLFIFQFVKGQSVYKLLTNAISVSGPQDITTLENGIKDIAEAQGVTDQEAIVLIVNAARKNESASLSQLISALITKIDQNKIDVMLPPPQPTTPTTPVVPVATPPGPMAPLPKVDPPVVKPPVAKPPVTAPAPKPPVVKPPVKAPVTQPPAANPALPPQHEYKRPDNPFFVEKSFRASLDRPEECLKATEYYVLGGFTTVKLRSSGREKQGDLRSCGGNNVRCTQGSQKIQECCTPDPKMRFDWKCRISKPSAQNAAYTRLIN